MAILAHCLAPPLPLPSQAWYWSSRNLNRYSTGDSGDFTTLTMRINGGTNGITDRRQRWERAKALLGCGDGTQYAGGSGACTTPYGAGYGAGFMRPTRPQQRYWARLFPFF